MPEQPEEWRIISGHPDYEASNLGRIFSRRRAIQGSHGFFHVHKGRYLSQMEIKGREKSPPYRYVRIDGKLMLVNRLVCSAFHGPPPTEKHQAAHINGHSLENMADNLVWATPKENAAHKLIHGTSRLGRKFPRALAA